MLSNPERRRFYDQFGKEGGGRGGFGGFGGFGFGGGFGGFGFGGGRRAEPKGAAGADSVN